MARNTGGQSDEPHTAAADEPLVNPPDIDRAIPNAATLAFGPNEVALDALVWSPAAIPASILSYAFRREEGLSRVEELIRKRASRLESGKLSKYDTYYAPQSPIPPVLWEYNCQNCRFYNEGGAGANQQPTCEVVGQAGDWFGGPNVHPQGWCALWLPPEGTPFFDWLSDRLEASVD